jgi:hypothetical protein
MQPSKRIHYISRRDRRSSETCSTLRTNACYLKAMVTPEAALFRSSNTKRTWMRKKCLLVTSWGSSAITQFSIGKRRAPTAALCQELCRGSRRLESSLHRDHKPLSLLQPSNSPKAAIACLTFPQDQSYSQQAAATAVHA